LKQDPWTLQGRLYSREEFGPIQLIRAHLIGHACGLDFRS